MGRSREAAEVVAYVERTFLTAGAVDGGGVRDDEPGAGKESSSEDSCPAKTAVEATSASVGTTQERTLRLWLHHTKARLCLVRGDGEGARRELEASREAPSCAAVGRKEGGVEADVAVRGAAAQFLEARALVLAGDHDGAMMLLVAGGGEASSAGGVGEGGGGKVGKEGGKGKAKGNGKGGEGGGGDTPPRLGALALLPCALSNAACIHHCAGRHGTAALLLQRAIAASATHTHAAHAAGMSPTGKAASPTGVAQALKPAGEPYSDAAIPPPPTFLYNLGLQQLALGCHAAAAKCFTECARWHGDRPSLWLRLAECAVGRVHATAALESRLTTMGGPHVGGGVGEGDDVGDASTLTSEHALMCLDNAVVLIERESERDKGKGDTFGNGFVEGAEKGMQGAGRDGRGDARSAAAAAEVLRAAVFAHRAYVHLTLNRPRAALKDAESLLRCLCVGSESWPSPVTMASDERERYALLGRCYAAEALSLLGRGDEAAEHIATCLTERESHRRHRAAVASVGCVVSDDGTGAPAEDGEKNGGDGAEGDADAESGADAAPGKGLPDRPTPTEGTTGQTGSDGSHDDGIQEEEGAAGDAALLMHLARVCASRGDLEAALEHARRARAKSPRDPEPALMMTYLKLVAGDQAGALDELVGRRLFPT